MTTRKVFNAFIRTHHITSRKKVQRLRHAAEVHKVDFVMLRSGGAPGLMYVESATEEPVAAWVSMVHGLRYKDYQNPRKVAPAVVLASGINGQLPAGFHEVEAVADFGKQIELRGLMEWWRKAMGYQS